MKTDHQALFSVLLLGAVTSGQVRDVVLVSAGTDDPNWSGIFLVPGRGGPPVRLLAQPITLTNIGLLPGNRQYCTIGGGTAPYPIRVYSFDRETLQLSTVHTFPWGPASGPYRRVYSVTADQEGDLLIAAENGLWRSRASDNSYALEYLENSSLHFKVLVDVDTGDYIVDMGPMRVTPAGRVSTIGGGAVPYLGSQDPASGDFLVSHGAWVLNFLFRMSPSGALTTVGPYAHVLAVDQEPSYAGAYVGIVPNSLNPFTHLRLLRLDRTAQPVTTLVDNTHTILLPDLVLDRSLNVSTKSAGARNRWDVLVDFPNAPWRPYACFVGMSGFRPGLPLQDGRVLRMNLDDLTWVALSGAFPAVFQGLLGRLDSRGAAQGRIDLNFLPPASRGTTFWLLATALDPAAPSGIAAHSDPWVVQIR